MSGQGVSMFFSSGPEGAVYDGSAGPANPAGCCVVIPAIKKSAVIPDQLIKKLDGKTLIQRALETARQVTKKHEATCSRREQEGSRPVLSDILVVTDSDEIRLICERAGVGCAYDPRYAITSLNIVLALRPVLESLALHYEHIIIYRASSPLITADDIEDAYARFVSEGADCLVTVKSIKYRLWEEKGEDLDALLFNEDEQTAYVETKALFLLRSDVLTRAAEPRLPSRPPADRSFDQGGSSGADELSNGDFLATYGRKLKIIPYFLHDRGVEITSYLDWWVCEKILRSRHILFVVAGYPAIGMGHIYRTLMLAHEIADHRITFLCTRESEDAVARIAARDYRTKVQTSNDLAGDVLRLRPDLVINDILNTDDAYMAALKDRGVLVVNFEDEGPGAARADLVVNALYEGSRNADPRILFGYRNFCLRDEFINARRNEFRLQVHRVLITFGGTDFSDYTRQTLDVLVPLCREHGTMLTVVAGPGYAHKEALAGHVETLNREGGIISFAHATNVMSREMEDADLAVCSAGRTVYELAHMRIPGIVLSHHAREDMHTFARPRNGFMYLGIMRDYKPEAVRQAFARLLETGYRRTLYDRMARFDFTGNKARVIARILALLR